MLKTSTTLRQTLILSLVILGFCFTCLGQEASRPKRGVVPNGSFSVSDIENINLLNGNVNIEIPLASLPPIAGGKLSWTISAQYNSKLWDITRYQENQDPLTWAPYSVDLPGTGGGWTIGRAYTIFFRDANDDFQRLTYPGNSGLPQWELNLINNFQWTKVVLRMPDGSEHEFRPTDHSSYMGGQSFLRGFYNVKPSGSPMRYYSVDGTYMFARISSTSDWTVYMPDGTQIIQANGIQRIQDTNGNKIKIFTDGNGTHYQDEQTGREIRLTYNPSGAGQYQVWYKTVGGVEHHIDINLGTTTVQGKLYSINYPGCEFAGLTQALFSQLEVFREIVFPQTEPGQPQRKFTFSYNSDTSTSATDNAIFACPGNGENYTRNVSHGLGELSQIVMPSGSIIDYSYNYDGVHTFSPFGIGDYLSRSTLIRKDLTHDGITESWTYDIGDSFGTVVNPDGSFASEVAFCSLPNMPGCASDKSGLTYRSVRPFTRVDRHWTNLIFSGGDNLAPNGLVAFNPVVDKEYTTLTDAQGIALKMSAKAYSFDYNGNVVQETHYDWFDPGLVARDAEGVPTGVPGSATVLRVINHSHYNQAATSSSGNVYAKRSVSTGAPLILNAPKETTLGASIAQFSYDGQAYNVAPTVGNLTTKKVWVDLDSKWITTSNTYNSYGNVLTATDGRGKITTYHYDDNTHALPNRVVVDPQNGTGTQTATTVYDFYTSLVTSQTDANNQVSTISYANQLLGTVDPFGRPGITYAPEINNQRRRVTTTYLDSARQVIVATDLNAENDKLLKTRMTTDMLGRPVLSEQTEDGANYTISVKNAYKDMGRVTLTSSPTRSSAASTDSWTRVTNDTAGRVIEVATFGGATQPAWSGTTGVYTGSVTTAYESNFTTVTDQAGKVRRSMVDAAGRLLRVDEPDGGGNLGTTDSPAQPTSYSYDVFDNLITVTQGSQTRTFTYDSLSRLRSAVNPESGTINYQYDDNANLIIKTDPRGVSTHFEYDSLNRVTRRWYNGSSSVSHTIHNDPQHPIPAGVGITNEARFYYDTQSLPSGAPSYSRGSSIGRLVAQTYGAGSNGDYFAFDVLGHPTLKYQQTGTINYQTSATYSLSGALTELTYPSGRTISNSFDQAGRLTSFSGNLGDGSNRTYSSGMLYSPTGALVKEQFGTTTPIYNKLFYNSRGQLAEIRESTSYTGPTDTDANRGAIVNNYSNNCTGICSGSSMADNNGNLRKQEIHIPSQTMRYQEYDYDSLNRLNWVRETLNGGSEQWKQAFTYDRWGNRTINTGVTYGTGINNTAFTVNTSNNRLGVPGGQSGVMQYDVAGNLTNDTYTGAGNRTYDGENKITSAWGGNNQAQLYGYDASGQRIKRTVDGVETWQVYGLGGELLAEYPASGAAASPQKEYGYRNGQLLVTAESSALTNFALNKTATQSSTGWGGAASRAVDGNTDGVWANSSVTHTENDLHASWQVDLGQVQSIAAIKVWNRAEFPERLSSFYVFVSDQAFTSTDLTTTLNQAGVSSYYTSGQCAFPTQLAINRTGRYVRVQLAGTNYLSLAEVQILGLIAPSNVALNKTATQSSTPGWGNPASKAVDGNTNGVWANGSVTHTDNNLNGWWQVDLGQLEAIGAIKVWNRVEFPERLSSFYVFVSDQPFTSTDLTTTQNQAGVSSYYTGGQCGFPTELAVNRTGRYVRVQLAGTNYLSIAEVQVWTGSATPPVQWLISDHLGTPRMIFDQTGALANVKRHDYLPFGEELFAPTGGRTTAMGYSSGDGVRQQFAQKERDIETGLDYLGARYFSPTQGRFTSPDPLSFWAFQKQKQDRYISNPQRLNKYTYVLNNPLNHVDPTGLAEVPVWENLSEKLRSDLGRRMGKDAGKKWNGWSNSQRQEVLNARAKLMAVGVWNNVKSIDFSQFTIKTVKTRAATPTPRFPKQTSVVEYQTLDKFWIDNSHSGWRIALTTDQDIRPALDAAGYGVQYISHPEGAWQRKEKADDIVLHFVGIKSPYNEYTQTHFDGGGGGASITHTLEALRNKNPSPDDVTRALGRNAATADHLRGISSSIDKLLSQK